MSTAGWIIMLTSVCSTTGLLVWSIYKVFATPGATEHLHSQIDIDPHDHDN